jgi:hypothetical protein
MSNGLPNVTRVRGLNMVELGVPAASDRRQNIECLPPVSIASVSDRDL